MRRLPKQRFFRGLMTAKMATPNDIDLIQRKMADANRYKLLNVMFTQKRGHRWAGRLQAFAKWLWENREAILQILGIVIMFAEDGTPIVKDEKDFTPEELKQVKQNLSKRIPTKLTPHGEKVEDFTEPSESVVKKEETPLLDKVEAYTKKVREEASEETVRQVSYDIGLNSETLHSGSEDDEVQSGETSSEATDRQQSDDV